MNATAIWFWKEWRSQRGQLAAYLALTLGLILLAGPFLWPRDVRGDAFRVGVSIYVGLIGVVVFVAPHCARGEVNGRDDQFLRRLPGALRPAFAGKLLFVALAALVLPLIGFTFGELTVCWRGFVGVDALFEHGPGLREGAPILLLALPWVFAAAFMLPGGRMAIGVAALLGFLVFGVYSSALALHPGLGNALDPRPHIAWLAALGLVVAGVACLRGRRGGGAWRSAKLGLATLAVGLLPSAAWLGAWVAEYRTPLSHLEELDLLGVSADGRHALATSQRHWDWPGVTYRIDLVARRAEVLLADQSRSLRDRDNAAYGAGRDLWLLDLHHQHAFALLDLATGEHHPVSWGHDALLGVPDGWRERLAAEARRSTPFRQAGGRLAWLDGGKLHLDEPDGTVTVMDWPGSARTVLPAGHGIAWWVDNCTGMRAFDFATRRVIDLPPAGQTLAVEGSWLIGGYLHGPDRWSTRDPVSGALTVCTDLSRSDVCLGNLRDGEVLMTRYERGHTAHLFAFAPASGQRREIAWGAGETDAWSFGPGYEGDSVDGWRDAEGRRWILGQRRQGTIVVAIDPVTATATTVLRHDLLLWILAIETPHSVLALEDKRRIVRIDWVSGITTVLWSI
jgi:hypothetical protein